MNIHSFRINTVLLSTIATLYASPPVFAVETVYYETSFETIAELVDRTPTPPAWFLAPSFEAVYGGNNHFQLSQATSHTGNSSLRFSYSGRNDFCNTCGVTYVKHRQGLDGVSDFVNDSAANLALPPYLAKKDRLVYNISNGYSQWAITAVNNDRLSLKLLKQGINGEVPEFNSGDSVAIARECGVDGNAASKVDRRSDCNDVITYFKQTDNPTVLGSQLPGKSIFRRWYLKIENVYPPYHQKLRYWFPENGVHVLMHAASDVPDTIYPKVTKLNAYGAPNDIYMPGSGMSAGLQFERDTWYYVEEEFKAANTGTNDGAYRLWFAKAGSAEETAGVPVLEVTGLTLPVVDEASLWGNFQHTKHSYGAWYIDDLKISDTRIGPLVDTGHNIAPLNPPSP